MTNSKKMAGQTIQVDAHKLSQGLKATFEGVAMVFDSLGVEADFPVPVTSDKKAEAGQKAAKQEKADDKKASKEELVQEVEDETENAADAAGDRDIPDNANVPAGDGDEDNAEVKEAPVQKAGPAASTVTLDDVTKIIVQKIKKDRGNNEKIGQILKTYGAVKVGELDEAKYEAFLTDVAAL